jgi:hypothetical protein
MLGGGGDPLTCNVDALIGSLLQTHRMIFWIVSVTSSVTNGWPKGQQCMKRTLVCTFSCRDDARRDSAMEQ